MKKALHVSILLVLALYSVAGDNIRGSVVSLIDPSEPTDGITFRSGDLIAIAADGQDPLLTGVKIEISIPTAVKTMRGAYAAYLYKNVEPSPRSDVERYRGSAADFILLPSSSRMTVHIPFATDYIAAESYDVFVTEKPVGRNEFPLIVTLLPVMKGIPAGVANSDFKVTVTYTYSNLGILELELMYPGDEQLPYSILLDGGEEMSSQTKFVLDEGIHTLLITSPHYQDVSRTFAIEGGDYKGIRVTLEERTARYLIEAPEGTEIYLDGEPVEERDAKARDIEPGEHTVVMKTGDYSISRAFSAKPGMTYTLSLEMDIRIDAR